MGKWIFTRYQHTNIHYSFTKNATRKNTHTLIFGFFQSNTNPKLQNLMYSFKSFANFWCDLNFTVNIGLKSVLTQCRQSTKMMNLLTFSSKMSAVFHKIHACWFLPVEFCNLLYTWIYFLNTDNDI